MEYNYGTSLGTLQGLTMKETEERLRLFVSSWVFFLRPGEKVTIKLGFDYEDI